MSDSRKNLDDVQKLLQSNIGFGSDQTMKFYNSWAESYEEDSHLLKYQAPRLAVEFLMDNFPEDPKEVQVLDVACGSGLVAKLMFELGFRVFVGVDSSEGMLEQAAKTGLYRDLKLALLGPEPLPAQTGEFDLVILVGGLGVGFSPVSVVRELLRAARAGGFICVARGNHTGAAEEEYQRNLDRELQLMEQEGLWSRVAFKQVEDYMLNPHLKTDKEAESYISGSLYLCKKSSHERSNE